MACPCQADDTIQGNYCYTYGDKESLKEAKELTHALAVRNAIESYRSFIVSRSNVKDFVLTNDIIQTISSGSMKDIKTVEQKIDGRTICETIQATVSPETIEKVIKQEVARRSSETEAQGIESNGVLKILRVNYIDWLTKEKEEEVRAKIQSTNTYEWLTSGSKLKDIEDAKANQKTLADICVYIEVLRQIRSRDGVVFVTYFNKDGEPYKSDTRFLPLEDAPLFTIKDEKVYYPGQITSVCFEAPKKGFASYKVSLPKKEADK